MNEQQLVEQKKALDESVEHWKRLATGKRNSRETIFSDSCALCQVYHNTCGVRDLHCKGCPIAEATGEPHCNGGPWYSVNDILFQLQSRYFNVDHYQMPEFKAAAQEMYNFLRGLQIKQAHEIETQQTAYIPTQDNTPSAQS